MSEVEMKTSWSNREGTEQKVKGSVNLGLPRWQVVPSQIGWLAGSWRFFVRAGGDSCHVMLLMSHSHVTSFPRLASTSSNVALATIKLHPQLRQPIASSQWRPRGI
jgi:hypothetical protein